MRAILSRSRCDDAKAFLASISACCTASSSGARDSGRSRRAADADVHRSWLPDAVLGRDPRLCREPRAGSEACEAISQCPTALSPCCARLAQARVSADAQREWTALCSETDLHNVGGRYATCSFCGGERATTSINETRSSPRKISKQQIQTITRSQVQSKGGTSSSSSKSGPSVGLSAGAGSLAPPFLALDTMLLTCSPGAIAFRLAPGADVGPGAGSMAALVDAGAARRSAFFFVCGALEVTTGCILGHVSSRWPVVDERFAVLESTSTSEGSTSCSVFLSRPSLIACPAWTRTYVGCTSASTCVTYGRDRVTTRVGQIRVCVAATALKGSKQARVGARVRAKDASMWMPCLWAQIPCVSDVLASSQQAVGANRVGRCELRRGPGASWTSLC